MIHLALTIAAGLFLIWFACLVLLVLANIVFAISGGSSYTSAYTIEPPMSAEEHRIAQRQREVLAENERRGQDYINRTRFNYDTE